MRRHRYSLCAVIVALLVNSSPIAASAPEPVVPVEGGDPPAYDPTEPYRGDGGGRCPAGNTRMGPGGELDLTLPTNATAMPGPVVPIDVAPASPAAPCLADVGLTLLVEAPQDKKPDGADGNLDGIGVPRSSLEGGFELTLPAQDRLITLSHPGENWELKSTSCSCSGWTTLSASSASTVASAPGESTSYPGPVLPVPAPPPGGPGGCSGSAPAVLSPVAYPPGLSATGGISEINSYVRPVLPLTRLQAPRVEWDEDGTVTITDPDRVGGTFTCVWTVELVYGQLDIETITKPTGEVDRFRYDVTPTGSQPNASALTMAPNASERLRWGPWSVELADLPEAWEVKGSNCSESDSSLVSLAAGPAATVGLDPDDAVTCRFELELLAPRPGRWTADERAGTVVCSKGPASIPFDLSQAIEFTRLRVRDEGDTLVFRGGGNRITFRRDRNEPLRYTGTKRYRQGGFTLEFDIRLNLRSETRMAGRMRAVAKGRGATCTFRRPLVLTHASAN